MTMRLTGLAAGMVIAAVITTSTWAEVPLLAQNNQQAQRSTSTNSKQGVWNLKDVDIRAFIRAVAEESGKNFAVDPRVTGKVTFISTQSLSKDELYQAFLSVLQVNGFVALPNGKVTKIVPDFVAKGLSSPIYSSAMQKDGDAMAVSVVDVKYIPAMELATTLNQFLTPSGRIAAYAPSNDIMIADRAGNIVNLMRIIRQIDQPQATNILVIRLSNAQAKGLVETLRPLLESKSASGISISLKGPTITADERTNSVLISGGGPEQRSQIQHIIAKLDLPTNSSAMLTEVLYLKHLQAERAAIIVNGIIQNYTEKNKQGNTAAGATGSSGSSGSSSSQQPNSRDEVSSLFNQSLGGSSSQSSGSGMSTVYSASSGYFTSNSQNNDISNIVQKVPKSGSVSPAVQWEESTNSLVVTAPRELMRKIRQVLARLDIRRPQVLIEAVIAEVSAERQKELGIEWNPSGNVAFQTRFLPLLPLSLIGNNDALATVAGGPNTVGQGVSLTYGENHIRFLLRALETDRESNVLATPNLVTLDNEPAQIKVGSKVPFATAQIQNNPTGGNPMNFFNREDVGLVLTINPQIAPNGMIKLLIQQELSAVIPGTAAAGGNPTTSERFIRTTVMADNGRILVLGGLLQNEWNENRNQLPWIANVPGVGFLFRDRSKTSSKTNLMIFLRPTILFDEKDDLRVSNGKYEFLRQSQLQTGNDNPFKRAYEPPVLPIAGEDVTLPSPFQDIAQKRPPQGYRQQMKPGEG